MRARTGVRSLGRDEALAQRDHAPRAVGRWRPGIAGWLCLSVALILESGCVLPRLPPTVPLLGPSSLSVGEWEGKTSQGRPIAFTVSQDEMVTSISLGYEFNDCSGTRRFLELK